MKTRQHLHRLIYRCAIAASISLVALTPLGLVSRTPGYATAAGIPSTPHLVVTQPSLATPSRATPSRPVVIAGTADGTAPGETLSIWYNLKHEALASTQIASSVPIRHVHWSYVWRTGSLPSGQYYIWVAVNRGSSLAGLVFADSPVAVTGYWSPVTPLPQARGDAASVVGPDGQVYAIGGVINLGANGTSQETVASVLAYRPGTRAWTSVAALPQPLQYEAAVTTHGAIYVIGGQNRGLSVKTVYAYTPPSTRWAPRNPLPHACDSCAAAVGPDGRIYVVGADYTSQDYHLRTQVYDPITDRWSTASAMPSETAYPVAVRGVDGRIYVLGGTTPSDFAGRVDAYAYDTRLDRWTRLAPMHDKRAHFGATVGSSKRLIAFGGTDKDVEAYDARVDRWVILSTQAMPLDASTDFGVAQAPGGHTYVVGGLATTNIYASTVYDYMPQ